METPAKTEITAQAPAKPTRVYSQTDRDEFAFWFSLPLSERKNAGYATIQDYADKHEVDQSTLWRWRQDPMFAKLTEHLRKKWGEDMTAAVMDGWKLSCMKGNPLSIELWLGYFHGYVKRTGVDVTDGSKEFGINDMRTIIDQLPEPLRSEHYANFRKLVDDASAVERSRSAEQGSTGDFRPADPVPATADQATRNVPRPATHVMAPRYKTSVRADMER